ncbi:hypothetical protein PsorP6_017203 [Peronosclerospora sorghi]|uniref:Uncharacterized protein n=1 Tax=Peronosclerospora sorghi TaxID=230839 RepID=A0ACC0WE80_9STRA|nr:hypothetical protein PsorP6_017203 [Peronosclerospora sorghi]
MKTSGCKFKLLIIPTKTIATKLTSSLTSRSTACFVDISKRSLYCTGTNTGPSCVIHMTLTVAGVGFLTALVITGWTALAWVLTPCFLVALLPFSEVAHTRHFYRRVARFMCVNQKRKG